jgi:MarR family transcriptional regulator, temperature-dependent positive regulator of motility
MFDHCMYFNTAALARQLEKEWAVAFKPFDLAPPQAFMLRAILEAPGALQFELAQTLAISRPTATRALDGLTSKKMIIRKPTDQDGRHMAIYPTENAIAIASGLTEASANVTKRLKKLLGDASFAGVVQQIRGVRSALK